MTEIWGAIIVFIISPIIGAIPLIDWFTYAISGKDLKKLGTGNISVSSAFYHGGKGAGIMAVMSEAGKGIAVVLMTRAFFPLGSTWEILALIALVMGRYWGGKGAGATNVTWGIITHNPVGGLLIFILGGVSFAIFRSRQGGKIGILGLMVVVLGAQNINNPEYIFATIALASLLIWIYQQMPDDLDLNPTQVNTESQQVFRFFRGDSGITSLQENLNSNQVGGKAYNLSRLIKWGYNVPEGWVIKAGDDIDKFCQFFSPSSDNPLVVRSSAVDEDSLTATGAGIYQSYLNITDIATLKQRIIDCFDSYYTPSALHYRQNRGLSEKFLAVIVQKQINGIYGGVAFSRNPVNQREDAVCIEVAEGATEVVSGKMTPQSYQVFLDTEEVKGQGNVPPEVLLNLAKITREIEALDKNIPQDVEWGYDGNTVWIFQSRPITTLQPLWTRKIASEVIPGLIRPLPWSINQPLTCGVWGNIFTIVLGQKASDLDFTKTATLHYHRAYFNATLLGDIFLLMGLPPESLEFLTRGSKFSKPPLMSTIKNIPGLWRLLQRELNLINDFNIKQDKIFNPLLDELAEIEPNQLNNLQLLNRIEQILLGLKEATYFSILAPLSFAIRQAIFKVNPLNLDNQNIPEIASVNELKTMAEGARKLFSQQELQNLEANEYNAFFTSLTELPDGESVLKTLENWQKKYGYLSEVATDISILRWAEDSRTIRAMFTKFIADQDTESLSNHETKKTSTWQEKIVQKRLNIKGEVATIYAQLLAYLRYSFLAMGDNLVKESIINERDEIFFIKLAELKDIIHQKQQDYHVGNIIKKRQEKWQEDQQIKSIPYLVYGNTPQINFDSQISLTISDNQLKGIPASGGIIEGKIKVFTKLNLTEKIDKNTIIVVPYTDAGWTLLLTQAGGLIAEVGGQLSHGAIVAREYGIPAVMDIAHATEILQDGQLVRLDGEKGLVEILH